MAKTSPVLKAFKKTSNPIIAISDHTISRIRELAWTGLYAAAIYSATGALSEPNLKPADQTSLPSKARGILHLNP